jgi:hypothetical protein
MDESSQGKSQIKSKSLNPKHPGSVDYGKSSMQKSIANAVEIQKKGSNFVMAPIVTDTKVIDTDPSEDEPPEKPTPKPEARVPMYVFSNKENQQYLAKIKTLEVEAPLTMEDFEDFEGCFLCPEFCEIYEPDLDAAQKKFMLNGDAQSSKRAKAIWKRVSMYGIQIKRVISSGEITLQEYVNSLTQLRVKNIKMKTFFFKHKLEKQFAFTEERDKLMTKEAGLLEQALKGMAE